MMDCFYVQWVYETQDTFCGAFMDVHACLHYLHMKIQFGLKWIIIFYMFNPIIWHPFRLNGLSWISIDGFHMHSGSLEDLYRFSSCPPKRSIVISYPKGFARGKHGKQSSFHHLLIYLAPVLWATLPHGCIVIPDIVLLTPKDVYWSFFGSSWTLGMRFRVVFPAGNL